MGTLLLVRHAQASFLADDYDQLSDLGQRQAALLGEHWAAFGWQFHAVFSGPRRRQLHTAEIVRNALPGCPPIETVDGLDEYHAEAMLKRALPTLIADDAEIARLAGDITNAEDARERTRAMERVFQVAMQRWVAGTLDLPDVESWPAFRARVRAALDLVLERARGRVAVFTSGGPIGVAISALVRAPQDTALELGWNVHNSAVSSVRFSGARRTLGSFNVVSHLNDPALWTYR